MVMSFFVRAFSVLLAARLVAALYAPIQDCDEVFNFWEPAHFLTEGWGLQTWEWSPIYAIRSWAYVGMHAVILSLAKILGLRGPQLFYFLRVVFAVFDSYCEARLARSLDKRYPQVARIYVWFSTTAAGLFHASVAFLPSSFAMYFVALSLSFYFEDVHSNIVPCLTSIAVAGIAGWPFALVLALPLGLYYSFTCQSLSTLLQNVIRTVSCTMVILTTVVVVDSLFFKRLVVVPYNIMAYNVFNASDSQGPNIFGTEPWVYYIINLLLNFNVVFPLALVSGFFVDLETLFGFLPMYMWLAVFTLTEHKEERFMYVIYPAICASAAFTIAGSWKVVSSFAKLPRALLYIFLGGIALISIARSGALVAFYTAPFEIYRGVPENTVVCTGREWYRYPSSYFINGNLKFIKSGFDGLLPGEFKSFSAIPKGMNDQNIADSGKLVSLDVCDYVVDIDIPFNAAKGEIDPREHGFEKDICASFLDSERSSRISRLLYFKIPVDLLGKRSFVDYCRYKRVAEHSAPSPTYRAVIAKEDL